ncbi:hypothetical protein [Aminobacter sp. HY435]|uniref:hypothetical protein n=1 Tax=Aminobacter sp. HY435 TaxID=2970917 RepID=UPI0022B9AA18|nr:hypothetical protein [Aminobacter sp. HY435]
MPGNPWRSVAFAVHLCRHFGGAKAESDQVEGYARRKGTAVAAAGAQAGEAEGRALVGLPVATCAVLAFYGRSAARLH